MQHVSSFDAHGISAREPYPVRVTVRPARAGRNRLTIGFRLLLAVPHLLLVGAPLGFAVISQSRDGAAGWEWGSGTGVLGAVAAVCALIAWFAILFTGRQPDGLWALATFYLRWRVRAGAYVTLLSDEYPPFGDADYPASVIIPRPHVPRRKWSVAFRIVLALPQLLVVGLLGIAWGFATFLAWISLLVTGDHPPVLYRFGVGMLRWSTRVEAYLLLLTDEYPPFSFD